MALSLFVYADAGAEYSGSEYNGKTAFYVAPDGSDLNGGTLNAPFKTVKRAKEEIKKFNKNMTDDIYVILKGGYYEQTEPLIFTEEDGGTNGYNVIYTSPDGEEAVISGGEKISGWEKYNDKLWCADYNGAEYMRQLWVCGRRARRAQSENMIDIADFFKNSDSGYKYDGIVTENGKYAGYKNPEDIQLHFARGWKSFLLNVESIEKGSGGKALFYMRQPSFSEAENDSMNHNIDPGHNFFLENAFEELDREGEFYFDRKEKKVYYYPREDEDMKTTEAIAAKLENFVEIKGENANKRVKNIVFKSLSFAHAAWQRPSRVGLVNDQAQDMHPDESDIKAEPGYTMVPANIKLSRAEKIEFIGNRFYDFGAAAIGMYQGVCYCRIEGNVFYDIADSAITVGTDDQAYEDKVYKGYNVAADKVTSASSFDPLYSPLKALDQNGNTGWAPNGKAPHWWQVDLEQPYEIDRVEIDARLGYDQSQTRNNFQVLGSDDPDFKTYKRLASWGAEPFEYEGTAVLKIKDSGKYRYIRIEKTNSDYFYLADVRIINEDMEYAPGTEVCKNISIQNNYITRTALVNYGAPGIQAYYVNGIDISNNEIYDVSYSGICTGWGWSNYKDSTSCRNNKINFNHVHKVMQMCFDGGAIYCLGHQPNSQIIGNYVGDQPNNLAAIYLDSGSRFHSIKENVTENAPVSFFSAVESGDNLWKDNYSTAARTFFNSSSNVYAETPQMMIPQNYPQKALDIMQKAGLSEKWKHIADVPGKNLWEYGDEIKTNNAKKEVLPGLMSDDSFKNYYLGDYLRTAREWLKLAETGDDMWQYPKAVYDEYSAFVDNMQNTLQAKAQTRDEILGEKKKFDEETNKFLRSRKKPEKEELFALADETLKSVKIGDGLGMVSDKEYKELEKIYNSAKEDKDNSIKILALESCLAEFDGKKVNLGVYDVKIAEQLEPAVINKNEKTIDIVVKHTADLSALKPIFTLHEKTHLLSDKVSLASGSGVYKVMTKDETAGESWTLKIEKPKQLNNGENFNLGSIIGDSENWYKFGLYNFNNYKGGIFGDGTLEFNLNIEARENDWPSIVFRSQEYQKSFMDSGNDTYVMVFTPAGIELHRFNNGIRTQFYGDVPGIKQIYGSSVKNDAFRFGEDNLISLSTNVENGGVHIVLLVNGEKIIDCVDSYEGKILQPGYFGTVSPNAPVNIGGIK